MTLIELDNYFNSFLKKEEFSSDISLNGIQIQNSMPANKQIKKIAFSVDACEQTAKVAAEQGADVLFVHHGLLWGHCQRMVDSFYKRISTFINNDLALIAYHIPLDANNPYGNNYGLANQIGLQNLKGFGIWKGMQLGVMGEFESGMSLQTISKKLMREQKNPACVLNFGKKEIKTVGIISGGAGEDVNQAVEVGLDLYITGEFNHEMYHYAKEMGINVIAGGHYETEIVGVNLVKAKVERELGLETVFIDIPTGL